MKIALIGYGKMGKAIEQIAVQQNHEILYKIDISNQELLEKNSLSKADVAIEFTTPLTAASNILKCFNAGIPVVCGTTGWLDQLSMITDACHKQGGALLYTSNFSIGVNIFFEINKKLATLLARQPQYHVAIEEVHHTQKKDSPSGTAISLAEQILKINPALTHWINQPSENPEVLGIESKRIDPFAGMHKVTYSSEVDDIEIIHTAHSRMGFASGAVLAATWIIGKQGIFGMKEVLGIG